MPTVVDLPAPVGPVTQDETIRAIDEVVADRRGAQALEGGDDVRHEAQRAGQGPPLEEQVRADAGRLPEREAEVEFPSRNELIPARSRKSARDQHRRVGAQWRLVKADQHPVDSGRRGGAGREQEVRAVAIGNGLQELLDALIHGARQCTVCIVPSGQVLIVSADERWLRVLEVTIRLGGAETISRRSVGEALRTPPSEGQYPTAVVVDLGAQTSPDELDDVRGLVQDNALPAVVILPERLRRERERFVAPGRRSSSARTVPRSCTPRCGSPGARFGHGRARHVPGAGGCGAGAPSTPGSRPTPSRAAASPGRDGGRDGQWTET